MGFIDQMRSEGFAVESIIRVLREQGVKIAARTYRAWKRGRVAVRTVTDAIVVDAVRDAAWRDETLPGGSTRRKMTPEGLYGRKKMTAFIRRTTLRDVSRGAVDRAMRALGLSGVTRAKAIRTTIPAKDGVRAGDLLNRDFTAPRPDHTWVTDFTYVRTWAGWVYVAFILDVFSQRIVAWHAQTSKHTDLVMIPLRMALWRRDRDGHPVGPGQLRHHSDAGSQGGFNWSSQHLDVEGVGDGSERQGPEHEGRATGVAAPVACRSSVAPTDAFPWAPTPVTFAASRTAVLAPDRHGRHNGGSLPSRSACRAPSVRAGFDTLAACHRSAWPSRPGAISVSKNVKRSRS
ncbi:Transposase [Propionibacterium freudenreichii]|nr:Transposase [Propionibacterium freudenreichii]